MLKNFSFFGDKKKIRKKYVIHVLGFVFLLTSCLTFCFSYYVTNGTATGSASFAIPEFMPRVNGTATVNQNIDLSTTIDNNKSLMPGARGHFKIDYDFTHVEFDSNYIITFDRTNIPNNIHFYVDEDLTTELTSFVGVQLISNSNKAAEHYIYWEWEYLDDPESNANDSLYMGQNISLPFTARTTILIENRNVIVNGYEKPTGRIDLEGTSGSFDMDLDFSNVSNTNYVIHFDKTDFGKEIHFYSDAEFTNEITYVSGIYDGTSTEITETVYWTSPTNMDDSLYYAVYLN